MQIRKQNPGESSKEYALRMIRDNIVNLHLEPGSLISETQLSQELGLSKTPVREALLFLSRTGIVEILPQRGSRITKIDFQVVEETTYLRSTYEKALMESIIAMQNPSVTAPLWESVKIQQFYVGQKMDEHFKREDNRFHWLMYEICGKTYTYNLINDYTIHLDRIRNMLATPVRIPVLLDDHLEIIRAIDTRDVERAKMLVEHHLMRFMFDKEDLRARFGKYIV